jgi:beta-carotene 3-hydroxylase
MVYLGYAFLVVLAFVFMEGVAWFSHKYIMHGFLWKVHQDHHVPIGHAVQKNDLFSLIFAIPAWLFTMFGIMDGLDYKLYIGIGITLYGIAYVLVHEGLIHQRIDFLKKTQNPYLLALRRGHAAHHKHLGKEDGECFGMLWVSLKYWRGPNENSVIPQRSLFKRFKRPSELTKNRSPQPHQNSL